MKFESVRALRVFAMVLIAIGSVLPSPSGKFFVFVIAFLLALPSIILGSGKTRHGGLAIGLVSLAFAVACFAAMKREQTSYVERAKAKRVAPVNSGTE